MLGCCSSNGLSAVPGALKPTMLLPPLLGCTTLTLCLLLVVPLVVPLPSSRGRPAHKLPRPELSNKISPTSRTNGLMFDTSWYLRAEEAAEEEKPLDPKNGINPPPPGARGEEGEGDA